MKTTLTLKYSSFFFNRSVNLSRNEPKTIDTELLDDVEIETLNYYIGIGAIFSSEGMIMKEQPEPVAPQTEQPQEQLEVTEEKEIKEEPVPALEVKQKPTVKAPIKRATRTTKK